MVPRREIPPWGRARRGGAGRAPLVPAAAAANLYVLRVFLMSGPVEPKFAGKEISRVIEIRGDQSLDQLHQAIFDAYERFEQHSYEFQFGRRPFDPKGPNHSRKTTLDELGLKRGRVFGYWFDFGDDWYHQVQVERIDRAIPTVSYPRVTRRVGRSPPQYAPPEGAGARRAARAPREPPSRHRRRG